MPDLYANDSLLHTALARAAKQFPEYDPQQVVAAAQQQHDEIMSKRPLVTQPMREIRNDF